MRIFLILVGLAVSLAAQSQTQEIYRWVDKNGQVHYSDQPGAANAERIILADPNAYESEATSPDYSSYGGGRDPEPARAAYESLSIVQPTPEQVFFGSDVTVTVVAELSGSLQPDHSVVFFVNGNRRQATGLSVELTGLPRGAHFLRATVLDGNGQTVISSQQITFHVRQASVQNPQSPVPARPQLTQPPPAPPPAPAPAGN